ncbi:MAG: MBL fold metallo-hydrolase [Pseudomonadota bacterium]|nr:MBL fold metallo-hydrolase [Pseudomonadota bacterium]
MPEALPFSLHTLELGPMENFVYLIQDHHTQRIAVVDPAWEVDKIIATAEQNGGNISDILLTHSHHDHINGLNALLERYDAQIHLLKPEAEFWGKAFDNLKIHQGGDSLDLGHTEIEIWHTPGHTPGSACYLLPNQQLISGDTLFIFGCGRCDLAGGDPEQMFHTLKKISQALPHETVIHPGHHYSHQPTSTLAEQLAGNPFMHFEHVDDFVHYRMVQHDRERQTPYQPIVQ